MQVGRFRLLYSSLIVVLMGFAAGRVNAASYDYLNDAYTRPSPTGGSGTPNLSGHLFPKLMLGDTKSLAGTNEQYSKYEIISAQAGSMRKMALIQKIDPDFMYFRQSNFREFLGYNQPNCSQMFGMPFGSTGSTTSGCAVYAGHWMYAAGTTLTKSLSATGTIASVKDASRFDVGSYVVIYNAPAGSFGNAEHAKVVGRNLSSDTLTLSARGYKSTARSHASGSIIAQHVLGQGGDDRDWSYNLSTRCPRDANGNTFSEAFASWMKSNYNKDKSGRAVNVKISGLLFDSDFYFALANKRMDANNDLTVDNGISSSGINWWGNGVEATYAAIRAKFPNMIMVSGVRSSRGFQSLSGAQMEGWPVVSNGFTSSTPKYDDVDSLLARYSFNLHEVTHGPVVTQVLSKTPTVQYPNGARPTPTSNRPFRFGFGLALLDDGYYGQQPTTTDPDPWYDEYSVDVTPGSSNYGVAARTNPNNESAARKHRDWLGRALGTRFRVYNSTTFAPSQSRVSNGGFESGLSGWSGRNVRLSRDTKTTLEGQASLLASKQISYGAKPFNASIQGPTVTVVNGRQYTLSFALKSSAVREVQVNVGSVGQTFLIGTGWQRYVMTFKAPSSGNYRLSFNVGRENTQVWVDGIYLFEGNADVFRRDFDHGIVVVNATPSTRTVNLNGTFQRIKGFQDSINNGATISNVTLAPYDAAILVRPDGSSPPPPSGGSGSGSGGSGDVACGAPNYNAVQTEAILLWQSCSTGRWSVRAAAGGSSSGVTYQGSVSASQSLSNIKPYNLEANDVLDATNPRQIAFSVKIWGGSQDGFDFSSPAGVDPCFALSNLPPGAQVLLGKNKKPVSTPINLNTLASCDASSPAAVNECGQPTYDPKKVKGVFVWRNCSGGGNWQFRSTGGQSNTNTRYTGRIESDKPISPVGRISLEGEDTVDANDSLRITYDLQTEPRGQDGFYFRPADGANTCVRITGPSGATIRVGSSAVSVGNSLNLGTLAPCQ